MARNDQGKININKQICSYMIRIYPNQIVFDIDMKNGPFKYKDN